MVLDRDSGTRRRARRRIQPHVPEPEMARRAAPDVRGRERWHGRHLFHQPGRQDALDRAARVSERSIDFARGRRLGVYLQSSFDRPPTVFAHGPGMKDPIQLDHFNDALESEWKLGKVEYKTFKGADDKDVPQWIVYPPDFDPNKKWPFVQVVHGGPHNGIMNDWSFRWNLQLWAAQGYVVGCVNFHGSSGYGQEFTDSITGAMGDKPLDGRDEIDRLVRAAALDRQGPDGRRRCAATADT